MTKKIVTCIISLCFLLTIFPTAAFPKGRFTFATVAEEDDEYEFSFSEAKLIIAKPTKKEGTPADEVINGAESLKHSITRPPTPLPNVNVDPIEPPLPTSNHTPTKCTALFDPNPNQDDLEILEFNKLITNISHIEIKDKTEIRKGLRLPPIRKKQSPDTHMTVAEAECFHKKYALKHLEFDEYFKQLSKKEWKIAQPIVNKIFNRNGTTWSNAEYEKMLGEVKNKIGAYRANREKMRDMIIKEQKKKIKELVKEDKRRRLAEIKKDNPCVPSNMPINFEGTIKKWIKNKQQEEKEQINNLMLRVEKLETEKKQLETEKKQKEDEEKKMWKWKLGAKCSVAGVFEAVSVIGKQWWSNHEAKKAEDRKDLRSKLLMGTVGIGMLIKVVATLSDTFIWALGVEIISFVARFI
jgi:hypothetical protein